MESGYQSPNENIGLMGKLSASIKNKISTAKETVTQTANTGRNLKYFMMFLGVGALFFFLAFLFLPVIYLAPHKFALLFTLGSMSILSGLMFYHGPIAYLKRLFNKETWFISLIYISSLIFTLYASLIVKSLILTILAVAM